MMNDPHNQPPPKPDSAVLPCPYCQQTIALAGLQPGTMVACPNCRQTLQVPTPGYGFAVAPQPTGYGPGFSPAQQEYHAFVGKKLAAGICAILLGEFGIHKFILGYTQPGIVMLVVTLVGITISPCCAFPLLGFVAMKIIAVIEGVIYLTKPDPEFFQIYGVQKREWF